MKVAVVVLAALAAARAAPAVLYPAATAPLVHAPRYDSAIIKSDRLGGNFAYSSLEAHAYAAVSPVVQNFLTPVGVSYAAHPIQYPAFPAYPAPAYPAYATAPAFIASAPVAAPIAPIYPAVAPGPAAPAAPEAPAAAPAPAPAGEPEAPAPIADSVESAASSDDSITVEAA